MAINIANGLSKRPGFTSIIIVARGKGALAEKVLAGVEIVWLDKKMRWDFKAFRKFVKACRSSHVDIVHAHSTTFFFALLAKWHCHYQIVWHDHYGGDTDNGHSYMRKFILQQFDYVLCASNKLVELGQRMAPMGNPSVEWFPNFSNVMNTEISGYSNNERVPNVLLLANFRRQKDHLNAIYAINLLRDWGFNFTVNFSGLLADETYVSEIREAIASFGLQDIVTLHFNSIDVFQMLNQADIGLLSSSSEGLPLVIVEYGNFALPVVSTTVGEIPLAFSDDMMWMVPPRDSNALALALKSVLKDKEAALTKGKKLQSFVFEKFSEKAAMDRLCSVYKSMIT